MMYHLGGTNFVRFFVQNNLLIRKKESACYRKFFQFRQSRSFSLSRQNHTRAFNSSIKNPGKVGRAFHTSTRRPIHPLLAILIKTKGIKVLKGLSIIFGRSFRKLHEKLPETVQTQLTKHKIFFTTAAIFLPFIGYYSYTHYETCPITGRKRWITFTRDQVVVLSELDYKNLLEQYKDKLIDVNHPIYVKNKEIVEKLISSNRDLDIVKDTTWNLNVIDDATVTNAFVLPNGQIFVFTGMLKMLNAWEEMAIILGHEMSHAILGHSQEQQSYITFGELLAVPLLAFIWFFFDDFLAFLMYTVQQYLYPMIFEYGFNLPYSRLLETEADEVGLQLAAKACFDPRWSVLLWEKMAMKEVVDGEGQAEEFDYLSTHPSNQKRSVFLEQKLPEALKMRNACNCPPLPSNVNPEYAAHQMRKCIDNIKERRVVQDELEEKTSLIEEDENYLKTNPDSAKQENKTQKMKNESEMLRKKLNELEEEYQVLVFTPQTGKNEKKVEEKTGVLSKIYSKVMGEVLTSGKLVDTLFDSHNETLKLNTVDIKKSALGKS